MSLQLIVGLGNPGPEYQFTRHNAGAIFLEEFARRHGGHLTPENKFNGLTARIKVGGQDLRLLLPQTFMNLSGQALGPMAAFFKIPPQDILVVYDELDLPPGVARLKAGGGAGGHNGIKDIIRALGNQNNFYRLRIGIGHPGNKAEVASYVLRKAPAQEQDLIDTSIQRALDVMPLALNGEWEKAMKELHTDPVASRQSTVDREKKKPAQ